MFQEVKLERFGMETILVTGLMVASSGMGQITTSLLLRVPRMPNRQNANYSQGRAIP